VRARLYSSTECADIAACVRACAGVFFFFFPWVVIRYRQVHDFWHVLCGVKPTVLGEIAVKWLEMVQTKLPVATLSAFAGPLRLPPVELRELLTV
jgi:ubiquinone biosynthesis protein Coq4